MKDGGLPRSVGITLVMGHERLQNLSKLCSQMGILHPLPVTHKNKDQCDKRFRIDIVQVVFEAESPDKYHDVRDVFKDKLGNTHKGEIWTVYICQYFLGNHFESVRPTRGVGGEFPWGDRTGSQIV